MASFEDRLKRLEELATQIRNGDLPLEDAVKLFEEGMTLSRGLEKELARIERKVEILINNPTSAEEKPELELFPELSESPEEDGSP